MNTILIVLIVVVIYLIYISSPQKEDFNLFNSINRGINQVGNSIGSGINQVGNSIGSGINKVGNSIGSGINQVGNTAINPLNLKNVSSNYSTEQVTIGDCNDVTMRFCSHPTVSSTCPKECAKDTNSIAQCREWAFRESNECKANPNYMLNMCSQACDEKLKLDNPKEYDKMLRERNETKIMQDKIMQDIMEKERMEKERTEKERIGNWIGKINEKEIVNDRIERERMERFMKERMEKERMEKELAWKEKLNFEKEHHMRMMREREREMREKENMSPGSILKKIFR